MSGNTLRWVCKICGYIHEGPEPPDECPVCAAPNDQFTATETPPKPAVKKFRCRICGYVHEGDAPPDECPVCAAPKDDFVADEPAPAAEATPAKKFTCLVCGYIHEGEQPPPACPICGAPEDQFEPVAETAPSSRPPGKHDSQRTFIIIGGGIAAVRAAEAIRSYDSTATIELFSREIPPPYHRLNLTPHLAGKFSRDDLELHAPLWYNDRKIVIHSGREICWIDPDRHEIRACDGSTFSYDRMVLANGAHPFVPPIPGIGREHIICMRTDADAAVALNAAREGKSCVVVGGGLLGLETAVALTGQGAHVSVVENATCLLPRQLTPEAAALLKENLERQRIVILTGETVEEFVGDHRVYGVRTAHHGILPADLVIVCAGVRPNRYLASEAGLKVNRGVVVNEYLKTSDNDIFAAGDVAEHEDILHGLWTVALEQGQIAGANAAGESIRFIPHPPPTFLKVADIDVFSIGQISESEDHHLIEYRERDSYAGFILSDGKMAGAVLINYKAGMSAVQKAVEKRYDVSALLESSAGAREIYAAITDDTV